MNKQVLFANEEIIVECEYTFNSCGYDRTALSFTAYELRTADSIEEEIEEYAENYFENMDDEMKWNYCKEYDLRPSEVQEFIADDYSGIRDLYDCDVLSEEQEAMDGKVYWYQMYCAGQHEYNEDYKAYGIEVTNHQEMLDKKLIKYWNKYHLTTNPTEESKKELVEIMDGFKELYPLDAIKTANELLKETIQNYEESHIDN